MYPKDTNLETHNHQEIHLFYGNAETADFCAGGNTGTLQDDVATISENQE